MGDPPLKNQNFENRASSCFRPKLGLEPKFHEPGTFGGFGNREQTHTHRQDSCFISIDTIYLISTQNVRYQALVIFFEIVTSYDDVITMVCEYA